MPRGLTLPPLELVPEWLTDSPFTAEDLRCITPASTIFRMSFGTTSPLRHRKSESSIPTAGLEEESDRSSFLWDREGSGDDETGMIEEPVTPATALPASPKASRPRSPPPSATPPSHSRSPSAGSAGPAPSEFDIRSPWFMQFDPTCLAALDDQLLQSPLDAFADLCYERAVRSSDSPSARATPVPGGYSWRRLSRLLSACPDLSRAAFDFAADPGSATATAAQSEQARESESDSDDTDSEQLASPEQPAPMQNWPCGVYLPGAENQQVESPYRPYASRTLVSKPLPALPSHSSSPSPPASPPPCSPPPLYMPPPAVSQAQLALLFTNAPPRPGESVHFSPDPQQRRSGAKTKGRSRSGTLRIAPRTAHATSPSAASPWGPRPSLLQRGLAGIGIRAGLSH
ncbi:hypothetical protein BD414DRAFT_509327 [Trametes punicea]|nr:hypothetical protein BD414DRAFT_509327 [Trametes punicea]